MIRTNTDTGIHTARYACLMADEQADSRERLISGTRELLWDRGYVGTSPTAILQQSGVGQGSLYHHFRGKHDLVLAAEQQAAADMQRSIKEAFAGNRSAHDKIADYLTRQREVLRGCSVGRLTADPVIVGDDQLRAPVAQTFEVLHTCLTRTIREGQRSGEISVELEPHKVAAAISATIQGGYALARAANSVEPFNRAITGILQLIEASTAHRRRTNPAAHDAVPAQRRRTSRSKNPSNHKPAR
ncbi:TetR/AcrR family transcriptional regulator [Mycobacterium avium subsp. paratuberculosis]|nr:HTH-type transcriptional repressor NemR [Mycobacterium avium subsp. paratuberculosis]OVF04532.1 HTH-type transcriptional repressor NemR [Mycobacterium avium subsp. paratuberculosis]QKU45672.1 transcriptional regulator, TetR family [Mycobacterium avium subsp. paratuberculosis]CAG6851102.1 TetR/AcrR family transcriptional regulator [Mycobacterium avium subsp. paratuberculosis]CAG6856915.1 TetR/AcrR family transcriptional regulator [Mycobacterium avium subsp. paratuberculosis]